VSKKLLVRYTLFLNNVFVLQVTSDVIEEQITVIAIISSRIYI